MEQERTFPNDPNPPPSAMVPDAPKVSALPAPASSAGTGQLPPPKVGDGSPLSAPAGQSNPDQKLSIVEGEDGVHEAFMTTPKDGDVSLGNCTLSKQDLEPVLKASGARYDPQLKMYDDVPEATLKACMSGRPSTLELIKRSFGAGEDELVRGAEFEKVLTGGSTVPEAMEKSNPERVAALARSAWSPWRGLGDAFSRFEAKPLDTSEDFLKWSVGKTASFLPSILEVVKANLTGRVAGGAFGAAFGPEFIPAGMELGAAAASFLSLYHMSLGGAVAHMADQKYTTEQIRKSGSALAVSGAVSSALWMYGVDAMAAPFAKLSFFQGLSKTPQAQKVIANWAYNYGLNAGIKMPALGAVQSLVSDFTNNMVAHIEDRPELQQSPKDVWKHAAWGALDMAVGSMFLGIPGAAVEAIKGRQTVAGEVVLADQISRKLEGVERLEPAPRGQSAGQLGGRAPEGGGTPSSRTGETASPELAAGMPPSPPPSSEGPELWRKTALPESLPDHPTFVKAVEDAAPHLPEGVDVKDKSGVVDAYFRAADEAHKFEGRYKTMELAGKEGTSIWTPEQEAVTQAKWLDAMRRMMGLKDLATFYRDPERQVAYKEWVAGGQGGEGPETPIDPYSEARGDYAHGLQEALREKELDMMLTGKQGEATSEQVLSGLDVALREQSAKQNALNVEGKVKDVQVSARVDALKSEMRDVEQRIGELASVRDRMVKYALTTGAIDRQLRDLFVQKERVQGDMDFYAKSGTAEPPERQEKLEMKPATLEDVARIGFKEGGKQSQARARELLAIARENGLTVSDVKKLVGNKMLGAMGDAQYKNFLEGFERDDGERVPGFREEVGELVEKKKARADLAVAIKERQVEKEQYVRQLYKMPAFNKMTTEQLRQYADIIRSYDKADVAFSPKRIEALKGTELEGARTEGEARKILSEVTGRPIGDMKKVRVSAIARALPEAASQYWNPALTLIHDAANEKIARGKRLAEVVDQRQKDLATAAIREARGKMGVGERILDAMAPQQRRVMAYLEAADQGARDAVAAQMGPAELKYAKFAHSFLRLAYSALEKKGMVSRFIGSYAPHVNKSVSEILRDLVQGNRSVGASIRDMLPRSSKSPELMDENGQPLGFNTFFRQSMFRTGELDPSRNVPKALSRYIQDYYRKMALDEAVPYAKTLSDVMEARDPESKEFGSSLSAYTKKFLNNKKGINDSFGAAGDMLAPALRLASTFVSIKYVAANYALQAVKGLVAVPISEFMAIDNPVDYARARGLRWTDQGQEFLKNMQHVTGKGVIDTLKEPGTDLGDYASAAAYGGFSRAHQRALGNVLLAAATSEELSAGRMTDARANEVMQKAGRWMSVEGQESIFGSHAVGQSFTQFKKWLVTPTLTIAEDLHALAQQVRGKGRMAPEQVHEVLKLGALAATAATVRAIVDEKSEDDSLTGRMVHYLRRAVVSVWKGMDPSVWMTAAGPAFVAKLAGDVGMLEKMERYKSGEHEDELKGPRQLGKDLEPRLVHDIRKGLNDDEDE